MNFFPPRSHIHVIVRSLLSQGENYYLCRLKGKEWFFLPGGHVEDGELTKEALLRELQEEIGQHQFQIGKLLGVCENVFSEEAKGKIFQHEINIVFEVSLPDYTQVKSRENHIEYVPVRKNEIGKYAIEPAVLKEQLLKSLPEVFLVSFKESEKLA